MLVCPEILTDLPAFIDIILILWNLYALSFGKSFQHVKTKLVVLGS